jgi:hypothetical protein
MLLKYPENTILKDDNKSSFFEFKSSFERLVTSLSAGYICTILQTEQYLKYERQYNSEIQGQIF